MRHKTIKELESETSSEVLLHYYNIISRIENRLKKKVNEIYFKGKISEKIKSENNGEFPKTSMPDLMGACIFLDQCEFQENFGIITWHEWYHQHLNQIIRILKSKKLIK